MKTLTLLAVLFLAVSAGTSCKKSDIVPDIVKQDTLGAGWSKRQLSGRSSLDRGGDIFFRNNTIGYLCDNITSISRSTDAGASWTQVSTIKTANIAVTEDDKAFFIGNNENLIYRITNGGDSISSHVVGASGTQTFDVFFADNNTGLCISTNAVYKTVDGGISWTNACPLSNFDGRSPGLTMYDNQNAWIAYSNKIVHTNGNLSNWRVDSIDLTETPSLTLANIAAPSPSIVYASSVSGYTYKSVDGGNTFTFLVKLDLYYQSNSYTDMSFVNNSTGYITLGSRIYKTTDGGNTWAVNVSLAKADIIEIHFSDASHGWALCTDNSILTFRQ